MPIITAAGAETLVNTSTFESQSGSSIAALANGQYVVVWVDYTVGQSYATAAIANADVKARIYNADGTPASGEFLVNSITAGGQIFPTVETLSDGHFLVSWTTGSGSFLSGTGTPSSGWAREFTAAGAALGAEFQIGPVGTEVFIPLTAALPGGGFVATWQQGGTSGPIMAQVYDANNATVGSAIVVDNVGVGFLTAAGVTVLANGNFVVTWNNASLTPAVSARVFTPAGTPVTPEFSFGGGPNGGGIQEIIALSWGGFAIGYSEIFGGTTRYSVNVYLPDGTPVGNVLLDEQVMNTNFALRLAPLSNGGLVAAWNAVNPGDGSGTSVRMQAYSQILQPIGNEVQVNTNGANDQLISHIMTLSNGDFVVTWTDASGTLGDASGTSVKFQRFHVDPTNQAPTANNDTLIDSGATTVFDTFDLTQNDIDLDGDPLVITAISNVSGGTVTLDVANEAITVVRPAGFGGPITFTYTLSDGAGGTSTATATILPTRDDIVTIRGSSTIDFLANDFLSPRPEGYSFFLNPLPSNTNVSYFVNGVGTAATITARANYNPNGYSHLAVGQTMTQTVLYSVINPTTGLSDYNAAINVTLQGWAQTGGTGADTLTGGAQADHLLGGTGAANTLIGGGGDDWYTVTAVGDSIVETANGGTDVVWTPLNVFVLAPNVEVLIYIGTPTVAFLGIGNDSDNFIVSANGRDELYGGAGNDSLSGGGGGDGAENTLFGGTGNDIFNVNVRGDSTIEYAGEGIDEVRTTFSIYGLQANVENLTYMDNATHSAGVGNNLANVITGGTGGDDLFGREGNDRLIGGAGVANTLLGQEGDDVYVVAAAGDSVVEFANQGIDRVETALSSFVLRADVENLTYTGTGAFVGIGAIDANTIIGGSGNDFLSGLEGNDILVGGSGRDELLGGAGNDTFRYLGGETGLDRIFDFTSGQDKIALSTAFFTPTAVIGFVQGAGAVALEAVSTFLYDPTTGIVSYDDDGNGAGAAVQIAQLNVGAPLAAGDLIFF